VRIRKSRSRVRPPEANCEGETQFFGRCESQAKTRFTHALEGGWSGSTVLVASARGSQAFLIAHFTICQATNNHRQAEHHGCAGARRE